jgi:thiol-disulfide isomerase/thioredoxin
MLHPRFATLSAFADGALAPARRPRVAAHVAGCARCRRTISGIRSMTAAAASLPDAALPVDGLERVLARRAAGERALLPVQDAAPVRPPARAALRTAAGVLLLLAAAAGLMQLSAPRLEAVSSEMQLAPAAPREGQAVRLAYTPGAGFAGARELVVRAHLRHPGEGTYLQTSTVVVLDTLRPDGDGVFRGEIRIPPGAVYAALTVETVDGAEVDTNQRRYWEVLVHDSAGRPLSEALEQRARSLTGRDWEGAFAAARERARLYPGDPESWLSLDFFEHALRGTEGADSLRAIHRARFAVLDSVLRHRPGVNAADMGAMYYYAGSVDDTVALQRWDARLQAEHPRDRVALQNRMIRLRDEQPGDPAAFVRVLDALWDEVGGAEVLALPGIFAAREWGDPEAIRRWAGRYLQFHPRDVASVAENSLSDHPSLRPDALRILRAELARLRSPDDRQRFGITRAEFRQARDRQAARVLAALGRHLLADGQTRAALDTLAMATEAPSVWDAEVFLLAGRARLQAGDTAGAATLLARVAVDPGTPAGRRDSVSSLAGSIGEAAWNARLETARREMRDRVLARAVQRPVPARARLVSSAGETVAMADAMGGTGAVVVFWSRHCGPAVGAVDAINQLAASLRAGGVRVIAVTVEAPSADFSAEVRRLGLGVPVYHDTRREAAHGFRAVGTPTFFVVDAGGSIRYEETTPADIPRQLAVLR